MVGLRSAAKSLVVGAGVLKKSTSRGYSQTRKSDGKWWSDQYIRVKEWSEVEKETSLSEVADRSSTAKSLLV